MGNHVDFYSLSIIGKLVHTLPRIMFTFWSMHLFQTFFLVRTNSDVVLAAAERNRKGQRADR